jgi:hypothetical protein
MNYLNLKAEAQQVALPAEIQQECQKQRTRKPATSGWFSSKFSNAYHGAKKLCTSAIKANIIILTLQQTFTL